MDQQIINGLLEIEQRAQQMDEIATEVEESYEITLNKKMKEIDDAVNKQKETELKEKLDSAEAKLKSDIKSIKKESELRKRNMQRDYEVNKLQLEEQVFNSIIGR